jgi:hypothetical protein
MSPWTESGIFGCSSSLFPDKTWRKKGIYFNLSMNNAKQAIVRKVNDKIIIFPEATAQSAVRAVSLRRGYYSAQLFTPGKSRGGSRIFRGVVSGGSYFWQGGGWWGCMGVVAFAGCVLFAKKCYVKNYCFAQCQANIQFLSRNRLTSIFNRIFCPFTWMVKRFCNIVMQFKTFDWLLIRRKLISTFNSPLLEFYSKHAETCALNKYSQWYSLVAYML